MDRMVVRVTCDLGAKLDDTGERLFTETAYDHSRAAIVRGLIAIGLATVERAPHLAPPFVGVRSARGRKKGTVRAAILDVDITFQNEHDDRSRRELVARRTRP